MNIAFLIKRSFLTIASEPNCSTDELAKYRKTLNELLNDIQIRVLDPIYKQHAALDAPLPKLPD
jgi:hypothetical protein